jgi:EAL domain-containing protein (putative c-di-GMP-specific phosphodiesterase class I)
MQEAIAERAELERDLREAIQKTQFELYFQLQVDQSRIPFAAEALVRWNHPKRGLVGPSRFIQLAEETGLVIPIGRWVLEQACARLEAWQKNPHTDRLLLSVNVSARQFRQPDFVDQVRSAIASHQINAHLLKLELTESVLLENIEEATQTMDTLRQSGVRFALDDFGTGYSSLRYLKKLPIDQLKIDQSFVRDITVNQQDRAIVRTIIAMASNLSVDCIAEGVETEEEYRLLRGDGCQLFQGHLFGCAQPLSLFEAALGGQAS